MRLGLTLCHGPCGSGGIPGGSGDLLAHAARYVAYWDSVPDSDTTLLSRTFRRRSVFGRTPLAAHCPPVVRHPGIPLLGTLDLRLSTDSTVFVHIRVMSCHVIV
jgi:hypothetical protein